MKRFIPLTRKINLIIISSLAVGVGIVIAYFAFIQNLSLRETSQGSLRQQSDILFQSIKNAMLPGEAPIAVQLFEDIRLANPAYKIFQTSDITPVVNQQRNNLLIASGFFVAVVLVLTLLLSLYLHGTLVRPVKHIGEVCSTVTGGDFSPRVAVANRDEIGELGETIVDWEFCFDCHANANEPHPYGDGNAADEFRDYVFFPNRKR